MQNEQNPYEMKRLIEKNAELLRENNELLHKLHRLHVISIWVKVLWVAVLVGLPFALYFYVLGPYFEALGSSYETFQFGVGDAPGFNGLLEMWRTYSENKGEG